jgi:Domain of unknown function (DUF4189)
MPAARSLAISTAVAVTAVLVALAPDRGAATSETPTVRSGRIVIAQTSLGNPDPISPPFNPPPTTAPPPLKQPPLAPSPRLDYVPPELAPTPPRQQPSSSGDLQWGAIGFTADGSYSSAWKMASQPEAEARVAKKCAEFGRGGCQVVSFSGQECVALATFIGSYRRRRWNLSFTAGGETYPEAQNAAMSRCNSDERTGGRCQPRTAACADGR